MVILDLEYTHKDYNKDILPFLCNGIFIDTSIMKIFIDGYINNFLSSKKDVQYNNLISLLDFLKINNKWQTFWVTPQIFTEICNHFHCDHNKRGDYPEIVKAILPILKTIEEERNITKNEIIDFINLDKPVIELGDISIFLSVDRLINSSRKVSILVKDKDFNDRYENYPNVLIIDYNKTVLGLSLR